MERIKTPLLAKNKKNLLLAFGILDLASILPNIFLSAKNIQEIPVSERENIVLFLENVMIRESGLFTLIGSKPMTLFDIAETLGSTEEDIKNEYTASMAFLEKCNQDSDHFHSEKMKLPDYKEFREKCLENRHSMRFLNHKKLWEEWLQQIDAISNQKYKFTCRNDVGGLFINVPNAVYILKKYYNDFYEITGVKFNIDTILDTISEDNSTFWDAVFKNHYLFGLLMGYGQKNAYLFDWAQRSCCLSNYIKQQSKMKQRIELIRKVNVDVNDLLVPYFVSFEITNEDVNRYAQEREDIVNLLRDKDWISFVLNQFKSSVGHFRVD